MNKTKLSYRFLTMLYLFRLCTYQDSQNGQNDQCLQLFKLCNSIMDRMFSATIEIPLQICPTNRFNGKTPEINFSDQKKLFQLMQAAEPDYQKTATLVLGIVKNEDYDIPSRNLSPTNIIRMCINYIKIMRDPDRYVSVQIIDSPHDGFGQGKTIYNQSHNLHLK